MPDIFDNDKYNAALKGWGVTTVEQLHARLNTLGVVKTGKLVRAVNARYYKTYGSITGIGLGFFRYGVYIEKGAGRGYGGNKGGKWPDVRGNWRKADPASKGKMGTGNRPARPWFNPVIEPRMEVLADVVVNHFADAAINSIRIN